MMLKYLQMLDINYIKNNITQVKNAVKNKNLQDVVDIDALLNIHQTYLFTLKLVETKRSLRNTLSNDIKIILNSDNNEKKQSLIKEATEIKKDLQELESKLSKLEIEYTTLLKLVPNIYSDDTPIGKDETENIVIKKHGIIKQFDFEPKDHIELGKLLDIIDTETASKVTGSRFYYLKNQAVTLQFALINFVFSTLQNPEIIKELAQKVGNSNYKTFTPIIPPYFVRQDVMYKMARLDPIDDKYVLEKDNMLLIGSAEHTLGPMHMNTNFSEDQLPLRYIGYSTAFRRESGSYGKDVKGILRTHQFDKLEMESFSTIDQGPFEQDLFVQIQEYLLQQLEIPYQVLSICTGDMGKPDYKQIDIECYIPSQYKYRETHTSDFMTDYQSTRLGITYTNKDNTKNFVYMNDATAFAIGRILIAILENNQQQDGSVSIPKVLVKYTGFEKIVPIN